jgi:hypothetical protein
MDGRRKTLQFEIDANRLGTLCRALGRLLPLNELPGTNRHKRCEPLLLRNCPRKRSSDLALHQLQNATCRFISTNHPKQRRSSWLQDTSRPAAVARGQNIAFNHCMAYILSHAYTVCRQRFLLLGQYCTCSRTEVTYGSDGYLATIPSRCYSGQRWVNSHKTHTPRPIYIGAKSDQKGPKQARQHLRQQPHSGAHAQTRKSAPQWMQRYARIPLTTSPEMPVSRTSRPWNFTARRL